MTEFYEISKEKLKEGILNSLTNITDLLNQSEKACQKYSDNSIALGLYTFAIEEFGKLLFLLDAYKADKESYQIQKDIFIGHESHKIKFEKALQKLPTECMLAEYGIEVHTNFSEENITIPVNPQGDKISILGGTTGTFSIGTTGKPLDLITRMGSFYLDWDDKEKVWKSKPKVLEDGLKKSITKLGLIVKGIYLKFQS